VNFANPTALWWLAALPLLAAFLIAAWRARRRALEQFAGPPLSDRLATTLHRGGRTWKAVLVVGAILFAILALARPRWGFEWHEVKHRGVDVFVLLDVSRSMLAEDVRPNRLTQAKFAVKDLAQKLRGDRVGLVAFAGTAFVQCPLTVDYEAFRLTLQDANPGVIPVGGSTVGLAIRTALKGFEAGEGRERAIVLITDGESTDDDALQAADEAARQGVRIYCIGIGTTEGELIPVREPGKAMEFVKDQQGQVVKSRLDEETLKQIALTTGGIYVRSAPGDFGMDDIYERGIAQLEQSEYESKLQKRYFERFQWPLGIALALLMMEAFISDRRRT
jgi:Ca-activated chloride channel family protein